MRRVLIFSAFLLCIQSSPLFCQSPDTLVPEKQVDNSNEIYGSPHLLLPGLQDGEPVFMPVGLPERDDWKVFFLLAGLAALAIARYFFSSRIGHFVKAAFGSHFYNQMEREGGFFDETVTYLLFFNFLVVFSLLLWQTALFFGMSQLPDFLNPFLLFILLLLLTSAFFLFKSLSLGLLAWVFNTRQATLVYLKNIFLFNQLSGLVMLPLVGYLVYNPSTIGMIFTWAFWLLINILKIARGSVAGYNATAYSGYYLFLYLCSVEMAPLLLFIKLGSKYLFSA